MVLSRLRLRRNAIRRLTNSVASAGRNPTKASTFGGSIFWPRKTEEELLRERVENFFAEIDRKYDDEAKKEMRFRIFKKNVKETDMVGNDSYTRGINEFADLTSQEFGLNTYYRGKGPDHNREYFWGDGPDEDDDSGH